MFYFRFRARPPMGPASGHSGVAYIECWIKDPIEGAARAVATGVIEQEGWGIDDLEEMRELTREDVAADPEILAHVEQAELDGMVFLFPEPARGSADDAAGGE